MTLEQHFREGTDLFYGLVFHNGHDHRATCGDALAITDADVDLVSLDPPYVPRADDNCCMKRYHFLEGLSTRWVDAEFHPTCKVRKLKKRFTPFSYRRHAEVAFDTLFTAFAESTIGGPLRAMAFRISNRCAGSSSGTRRASRSWNVRTATTSARMAASRRIERSSRSI